MARPKNTANKWLTVRARGRGASLDLLDHVSLRDGDEVLVSISEPVPARDLEALRSAAGAWKGMINADDLISNIYADRLVSTRPSPGI